jgi:hypothetical protein
MNREEVIAYVQQAHFGYLATVGIDNAPRVRGKVFLETCQAVQNQFKEDNPKVGKLLPPQAQHLFRLHRLEPEKIEFAPGLTPYSEVDW